LFENGSNLMRILLCVPRGCGFNDVLCQIWQSLQYAVQTDRELLIDTRFCGLADHLSHYVHTVDTSLMQGVPTQLDVAKVDWKTLNQLSCYPSVFKGSLDLIGHQFLGGPSASPTRLDRRLFSRIMPMLRYLRCPSPELPPLRRGRFLLLHLRLIKRTFNLHCTDDRQESLVLHHRSGGGLDSIKTIGLLRLNPGLRDEVLARLSVLGEDYDAIHFRHTDYKTDYESLINSLERKLVGRKVLVCSDNPRLIEYARLRLTASEVICVAPIDTLSPDIDTFRPAHYQWHLPLSERRLRNIAMLTDLIGMARAKHLYYGGVTRSIGYPNTRLLRMLLLPFNNQRKTEQIITGRSGFAALANELHNQPDVLDRFIG
jgi:hypothetical protein